MIPLDPQLLFQRLVTAGMRQERMGEVFTYELCSYPPSMFENRHSLLPADKPALAEANANGNTSACWGYQLCAGWWCIATQSSLATEFDIWRNMLAVLQVCWTTLWPSFSGVWWIFCWSQHKRCCSSTKSWWPNRASVNITPAIVFNGKKEQFLRNNNNKEMFIIMLSKNLEQAGCHFHNAVGDADLLITQTVTAVARTSTSATILVGDDTDLLILLCHHVPSDMTNVYFWPEPRHMSRRFPRCWNIAALKLALGPEVCNSILFAHAILGCDSTSRLYGLGKGMAIKLLRIITWLCGFWRKLHQFYHSSGLN